MRLILRLVEAQHILSVVHRQVRMGCLLVVIISDCAAQLAEDQNERTLNDGKSSLLLIVGRTLILLSDRPGVQFLLKRTQLLLGSNNGTSKQGGNDQGEARS